MCWTIYLLHFQPQWGGGGVKGDCGAQSLAENTETATKATKGITEKQPGAVGRLSSTGCWRPPLSKRREGR